jgi:hypothetical protein
VVQLQGRRLCRCCHAAGALQLTPLGGQLLQEKSLSLRLAAVAAVAAVGSQRPQLHCIEWGPQGVGCRRTSECVRALERANHATLLLLLGVLLLLLLVHLLYLQVLVAWRERLPRVSYPTETACQAGCCHAELGSVQIV